MFALLPLLATASLLRDESLNLKERPVTKVVNLLKNMQTQLTKEQKDDEDLYDKLSCWCETNDKEKTAAIATANARIEQLTSDIEAGTAKSADLTSTIESLNAEISKDDTALREATEMRTKALAEFNAEEKDLMQSIQSLGSAITVLSKHHESFLQLPEDFTHLTTVVKKASADVLMPSQRRQLLSFLEQPAGFKSYSSQSGAIFGILKQMKETFETNLAASQKEEASSVSEYTDLKAAKESEIASGEKMVKEKTQTLAETDEQLATDKNTLSDTEDALAADTAFLADLKNRCREADAEFEERSKTRSEEIAAVGETIGILTSDDAHDLFSSTLGFIQTSTDSSTRRKVSSLLQKEAAKSGNLELMSLAASVKLDAFTEVKSAIAEMVASLKKEQKEEEKHRDFCIAEFAENDKNQAVKQDEINDLTASIADMEATLDTLAKDLKNLETSVAEMKTQMTRASETRELENKDFQETVADQRATQTILTKALQRMEQFYNKDFLQTGAKVRQEPGAAAPPPPEGFKEYKKNEGGGGAMGMIKQIIDEAKTMETEGLKAESDSQVAYEEFMKDSNKSIKASLKSIADKTGEQSSTDALNIQAKADKTRALDDSEKLFAYKADLHKACDFVMKNFDARQTARASEIEALRQAVAILSGAQ